MSLTKKSKQQNKFMQHDLISIIIPAYNAKKYLISTNESVLNQTYKKVEILVCDDGSTDGTYDLISEYMKKYPFIRYLRNEKPKGACAARNLGINAAEGEYITGLDDDDEFDPKRIELLINQFKIKEYSFLSTGLVIQETQRVNYANVTKKIISLDELLYRNIVGNQIFTKTESLQLIDGFDENFPAWQDYETWIRLCVKFGDGYSTGDLTYIAHREHEMNRISTSGKIFKGYQMLIAKHGNLMSRSQIDCQFISYKVEQNEKLGFSDLIKIRSVYTCLFFGKCFLRQRFPALLDLKVKIYNSKNNL